MIAAATGINTARGDTIERWTPELNLGAAGRLPEDWLPDEEMRVALYCRLARLEDAEALAEFCEELEDRFGTLPPEAGMLMRIARVRMSARDARIARIDAGPAAIALTPRSDFQSDPSRAGLAPKNGRLLIAERIDDPAARIERLEEVLNALTDV